MKDGRLRRIGLQRIDGLPIDESPLADGLPIDESPLADGLPPDYVDGYRGLTLRG